jgi:threonine aldolase
MVALSKGLGAPVGSLLVSDREWIVRAREVRKLLGGGMRQVGVLAAAGLVAVRTMRARLADDHRRARALAEGLVARAGATLPSGPVETNLVIVRFEGRDARALSAALERRGVLALPAGPDRLRFATHFDVDDDDVAAAVEAAAGAVAAPAA